MNQIIPRDIFTLGIDYSLRANLMAKSESNMISNSSLWYGLWTVQRKIEYIIRYLLRNSCVRFIHKYPPHFTPSLQFFTFEYVFLFFMSIKVRKVLRKKPRHLRFIISLFHLLTTTTTSESFCFIRTFSYQLFSTLHNACLTTFCIYGSKKKKKSRT